MMTDWDQLNDYLLSRHTIYIGFECHTGHKIHIWAWLLLSPGIRISKKGYKTTLGIKCVFWKGKKKERKKSCKRKWMGRKRVYHAQSNGRFLWWGFDWWWEQTDLCKVVISACLENKRCSSKPRVDILFRQKCIQLLVLHYKSNNFKFLDGDT